MTASNSLYRAPELYDAEFGDYRADLRFYRTVLDGHPGLVVELGAGTGRLYHHLQPARYVGVDASDAMLRRFRARAGAGAPPLMRADLRVTPLPPGSAAVVVLAYNVLQHIMTPGDLEAALVEAARVAGPNGVVALDTFMPPWPGSERHDDTFCFTEQRRHPDGSVMHVAERTTHDVRSGVQVTRLRFQRDGGGAPRVHDVARRLWEEDALWTALAGARLGVLWSWGDVDGAPLTKDAPRFMVCCAPVP